MGYGFLAKNAENTILINSDDSGEKLYLRRPHKPLESKPGYGTLVVNQSNIARLNELDTPLPNTSIVFFRPVTDNRVVRAYSAFTSNGLTKEWVVTCTSNVEWMIFDEVNTGDLVPAELENNYGLNIYKSDGTTLHWSSNSLNARVKSILEGAYSSTTIGAGRRPWVTGVDSLHSISFQIVGYGADKEYYIYRHYWGIEYSSATAKIESLTSTSGPLDYTGTSNTINTIYYQSSPKALVADLGDLPS